MDAETKAFLTRRVGADYDKPRVVTIETFCENGKTEWSPDLFLATIQEAISEIPRGCASKVALEGGYDGDVSLTVSYERLETPAEVQTRIAGYIQSEQWANNRLRSEYERLKRIFEPSGGRAGG